MICKYHVGFLSGRVSLLPFYEFMRCYSDY